MNEELDSQLSAMFDDELPEQQCELLAKRLARDEALKARWGRYAAIGAAIRAERGIRLDGNLARRVSAAISAEAPLSTESEPARPVPKAPERRRMPWSQLATGVGVAASVAVLSIMWLRAQAPGVDSSPLVAQTSPANPLSTAAPTPVALTSENSSEPDSYTVPLAVEPQLMVPASAVAKYMLAHSEYSSWVNRRTLLSTLVASEPGTAAGDLQSEEQAEETADDAP
jgi:sigma-E factor negative regulatory protein RseA